MTDDDEDWLGWLVGEVGGRGMDSDEERRERG